jgi:hypothetical protein
MSHSLGHLGFNFLLGVSLGYLIHGSNGCGLVCWVYSLEVGPNGSWWGFMSYIYVSFMTKGGC